jgi:hypothetical protein
MHSSVGNRKKVNRLSLFAVAVVCFGTVSATSAAAQTPDPNCCPPATPTYTQYGTRYYGAIDPYPIGYYPYATNYAPTAVGVPYALGYYPYPQPVATYAVPAPYAVGYYGYAGYAGSPYFGFPAWGWGPVYPYGFGYGF